MLKNIGKLLLVIAVAIGTTTVWSSSASAATPPDSCFDFDSGTGTIVDYYHNENNNIANPACTRDVDIPSSIGGSAVLAVGNDAFRTIGNEITSVTIPSSVTSIGVAAFEYSKITTLVIPDSVLTIGERAFNESNISSLTLGNGLTTIESDTFRLNPISTLTIPNSVVTIKSYAFSLCNISELSLGDSVEAIEFQAFPGNKIASVQIPDSVTSIGQQAFLGQSNIDGDAVEAIMNSGDPAQMQTYLDEIFYTRLYTESRSNPNSLTDDKTIEPDMGGDVNNDGDQTDSFGGHLINPASLLLSHEDDQGNTLNADTTLVGSGGLVDYLANQNDDNDLARYYRLGQTPSISPLSISGYNSPAAADIALDQIINPYTFVYTAIVSGETGGSAGSSGGGTDSTLADTGAMILGILGFATILVLGGYSLVRRPHKHFRK